MSGVNLRVKHSRLEFIRLSLDQNHLVLHFNEFCPFFANFCQVLASFFSLIDGQWMTQVIIWFWMIVNEDSQEKIFA